jgi:hypothetical protein
MEITSGARKHAQRSSFFCLQNEFWRVIGLDTGNESVHRWAKEYFFHLLNRLPLLKNLEWVQGLKTWLPEVEMDWLSEVLETEEEKPRGLIFMTHHQVYTALDGRGPNPKPGEQVGALLPGREAIWFHGHGHIQATYRMQALARAKDFAVAARAIGHGSDVDPVKLDRIGKRIRRYGLEYVDNRGTPKAKKGEVKSPHNGYAVSTFRGPALSVDYFTLQRASDKTEKVLSEAWTVNKGVLSGPTYEVHLQDNKLVHFT